MDKINMHFKIVKVFFLLNHNAVFNTKLTELQIIE